MMHEKNLIFDLDGTLLDTEKGILDCYKRVIIELGLKDLEVTKDYLALPVKATFEKYIQDIEMQEKCFALFKEYYFDYGLYDFNLYEGISELIKDLDGAGYKLFVATSKIEKVAYMELLKVGLTPHFEYIGGASIDEKLSKKVDIIRYVMDKNGIKDINDCIMIGDRFTDISGANFLKMKSIGVLYGYGSKEELENCNATYLVKDVSELRNLLLHKFDKEKMC